MYPSPPGILWVPASEVLTKIDPEITMGCMLSLKGNPVTPLRN
jgi:hypothetical protein